MVELIALTPPGRFPTVVRDPGDWWSAVARAWPGIERPGINAAWWHTLCDPFTVRALAPGRRRFSLSRPGAEASASTAADALERFTRIDTYASMAGYVDAVEALAIHLAALGRLDPFLGFSPGAGVRVAGLRYGSSRELVSYAEADTPLARIISRALDSAPIHADAALVDVSSPEDLLTALITVRILRKSRRIGYAALVDHGYENFSLSPHVARLRGVGAFASIFDAIVEEKDDRDVLVPRIVDSLAGDSPLRGYLRIDPDDRKRTTDDSEPWFHPSIAPPTPTFAPWPILVTRVSQRRCYWARCTFCVHNLKYADRAAPSVADVPRAVGRLRAAAAAGYRQAILADEALSPAMLRALGSAILEDGLLRDHPDFRWACRSKLERAHDSELLSMLGRAGCAEILFGLESTSDRVLGLMDKRSPGLTTDELLRILGDMEVAGISAHANLIVGFPGDTRDETRASVEFLAAALAPLRNATYAINPFTLFPGTPIAEEPSRFGIGLMPTTDDIPYELAYRPTTMATEGSETVLALRGQLEDWLAERLGWRRPSEFGPGLAAQNLYFRTGHGLVFKTSGRNPMDRMLSPVA